MSEQNQSADFLLFNIKNKSEEIFDLVHEIQGIIIGNNDGNNEKQHHKGKEARSTQTPIMEDLDEINKILQNPLLELQHIKRKLKGDV